MAVFTVVAPTAGSDPRHQLLETVAIVNQTANSTAVSKAVVVPRWATSAVFLLSVTTMGGTSPLLDFKLSGVNWNTLDTSHAWDLGGWDGITQLTGAVSPVMVAIDVGPNIAADDTGSATASCRYGVNCSLPPVIVYTYTTDGTTDDEDYDFTISVSFKGSSD